MQHASPEKASGFRVSFDAARFAPRRRLILHARHREEFHAACFAPRTRLAPRRRLMLHAWHGIAHLPPFPHTPQCSNYRTTRHDNRTTLSRRLQCFIPAKLIIVRSSKAPKRRRTNFVFVYRGSPVALVHVSRAHEREHWYHLWP